MRVTICQQGRFASETMELKGASCLVQLTAVALA